MHIHLHVSYKLVTLLTKGFFDISFTKDVGAITIRKLSTMEWNGMTFSLSQWQTHSNITAQGAKWVQSHVIKVQFPSLNFQFYNIENSTLLVGMIEEVLEVEKPNSYIKQQTWPMVTIEMSHITWLLRSNPRSIRLSSLDIKNPIDATYFQ